MDTIRVNQLQVTALIGAGACWPPRKPTAQPLLVTAEIAYDVRTAAATDDLSRSINYSAISTLLRACTSPPSSFDSLEHMSRHMHSILRSDSSLQQVTLNVVQLKAPLHCRRIGVRSTILRNELVALSHFIEQLHCDTIIGVNPNERLEKQPVEFDISIEKDVIDWDTLDFRHLLRSLYEGSDSLSLYIFQRIPEYWKVFISDIGSLGVCRCIPNSCRTEQVLAQCALPSQRQGG
jgi:dihydroneopterin aldolase / 2-amino-4-hydroxy-6-hydroxymethyldihydropteridine diphosphokinase / dihydropteroate synthase